MFANYVYIYVLHYATYMMLLCNNYYHRLITCSLQLVPKVTAGNDTVTILEGQPKTITCLTSEDKVTLRWLLNGTVIALDDEKYMFSPPGINTMLTIVNPSTSDRGNYTCEIDVQYTVETSVTIMVTISQGMYCIIYAR